MLFVMMTLCVSLMIQFAEPPTRGSNDELHHVARVEGVSLSMTVPRRIDLHQPILVSIQLENRSGATIVTNSDNRVYMTLRLETADGDAVPMTELGRKRASQIRDVHDGSIKNGEKVQVSLDLSESFVIDQEGVYNVSIAQAFLLVEGKASRALSLRSVPVIVGRDIDIVSPE
jgi:hypothetical protein